MKKGTIYLVPFLLDTKFGLKWNNINSRLLE